MGKPLLYLIAGPTASGKSAKALEMALELNGVIINSDAMQVYSSLPILTAQPDAKAKKAAPHRLYEITPPTEKSSAGIWGDLAVAEIENAITEGKTPIIVGGTGLYFKALMEGLAEVPPIPDEVRTRAQKLYDKLGSDAFRAKLAEVDPLSAKKIKPNDRQRLVRAYEVASHTGKTLEEWQNKKHKPGIEKSYKVKRVLLLPERSALYSACDGRFLKMMGSGALDEVREFMKLKVDPEYPAAKVLGVRELTAYIEGRMSLDEAISKAQQSTRNYAKRQVTWFKNQWDTPLA